MSEETKSVASETVSEQPIQETPASSPDVGALIAESKKYRTRAQDAEARIAEMEKTLAKSEEKKLKEINIEWLDKKSLCIVLCSNGYPDKYNKNVKIENLNKLKLNESSLVFHAGTKLVDKDIFATGGRVLNIVNVSNSFAESKKQALTILKDINWTKGFYRKDIGYKVIS